MKKEIHMFLSLLGGMIGVVVVVFIGYVIALMIARGPVTALRILTSRSPTIQTHAIFPQRIAENRTPPSTLSRAIKADFPETITFPVYPYQGTQTTKRLNDLFTQTDTKAFIVVQNDTVIYEAYPNGGSKEAANTSFSVAKSFVSTLIGIAIDEGKIKSVDDPVVQYLPELTGRGLDKLTIRDMLRMSSGVPFEEAGRVFPLAVPFSDDPLVYYATNLREVGLNVRASDEPIGAYFRYNNYYLILEGMLLERATGVSITQYFQEKLWKPLGAEYPAAWNLDSESDGFEKTDSGLNAHALDFARFGLMFLHHGQWNGHQIVSERWVKEATTPDPNDQRPWVADAFWPKLGGYYKFHWWGFNNPDGTYDYMARGYLGQIIYISPARKMVVVRFGGGPQPDSVWPFAIRALITAIDEQAR